MRGILESVRADVEKLVAGGVDGLLFCDEGDRPYALKADFDGIAVMTRVITELAPADRPFRSTSCGTGKPRWPLPWRPERLLSGKCSRASTEATWASGTPTQQAFSGTAAR